MGKLEIIWCKKTINDDVSMFALVSVIIKPFVIIGLNIYPRLGKLAISPNLLN